MATKKRQNRGIEESAIMAAEMVASRPAAEVMKNDAPTKMIAVRMNEVDYNDMKSLFAAQGLPLARAGNLALYYIAEQLKAGRISIGKAGIIDRRG